MEQKQLSLIIRQIYLLAHDMSQLNSLLGNVLKNIDCRSMGIHIVDRDNLHVISEMGQGCIAGDQQCYDDHYQELQPYLSYIRNAEQGTHARELYCFKGGELRRLEHASDLFMVSTSPVSMFSLLFREGSFFVQLAFIEDNEQQELFHQLLHIVTLLRPHVHKAFDMFHTIEQLKSRSVGYVQTMDNLHAGVILFDGSGESVFSNRRAREVLDATDGLTINGGTITGPSRGVSVHLKRMVRNAVHYGMDNKRTVTATVINSGEGDNNALSILAVPLHPDLRVLVELEVGIYAALVIGVCEDADWIDPEIMQLLYGLTPAEARLAIHLSTGKTLDAYTKESGIKIHTARGYLKLIFQKTKTRRQAELVALLKSIPVSPL